MIDLFGFLIAVFAGVSFYLITSHNIFRVLLGILLLSQGVHLFLFTRGQLLPGQPALITEDLSRIDAAVSDPLVQALILTAIVISFAMTSFAVALFLKRTQDRSGEPS